MFYIFWNSTYFFALMQKSSKKNQGYRKMAKNYCVSLSQKNSLRRSGKVKLPRAQTVFAPFELRSKTAYYVIFLTPFFWGHCPKLATFPIFFVFVFYVRLCFYAPMWWKKTSDRRIVLINGNCFDFRSFLPWCKKEPKKIKASEKWLKITA